MLLLILERCLHHSDEIYSSEKSYGACPRSDAGKRKNEFTDGQW